MVADIPENIVRELEAYVEGITYDFATDGADLDVDDVIRDLVRVVLSLDPAYEKRFKAAKKRGLVEAAASSGEPVVTFEPVAEFEW